VLPEYLKLLPWQSWSPGPLSAQCLKLVKVKRMLVCVCVCVCVCVRERERERERAGGTC
jgi:hypothetical protein